jgi:hypothetical protein
MEPLGKPFEVPITLAVPEDKLPVLWLALNRVYHACLNEEAGPALQAREIARKVLAETGLGILTSVEGL